MYPGLVASSVPVTPELDLSNLLGRKAGVRSFLGMYRADGAPFFHTWSPNRSLWYSEKKTSVRTTHMTVADWGSWSVSRNILTAQHIATGEI